MICCKLRGRKWSTLMATSFVMITALLYCIIEIDEVKTLLKFTELENYSSKSTLNDFFTENLNCKSMFTINANGIYNFKDPKMMKDIRSMEYARQGNPVSYLGAINNLGKYMSKIYQVKFKDKILDNKKNLSTNVNEIHNTNWPYVSCEAHNHSTGDIKRCIDLLQKKVKRPFRLTLVGDSMIRVIMQGIVLFLKKDLQLKYLNDKKHSDVEIEFLKGKFKSNVTVIGEGIEIRFYWAPFLDRNRNPFDVPHQGANDLLQNWVEGDNLGQDPIPDILYIGSGPWFASSENRDFMALEYFTTMLNKIFPKLKVLSMNTMVLWHVHPTPGKNSIKDRMQHLPYILDWMNQAAFLKIKGTNIWFWDTLAVLTSKERKECTWYQPVRNLLPSSWGCLDRLHPGVASMNGGVNMIFNMACNHVMNIKGKCCS